MSLEWRHQTTATPITCGQFHHIPSLSSTGSCIILLPNCSGGSFWSPDACPDARTVLRYTSDALGLDKSSRVWESSSNIACLLPASPKIKLLSRPVLPDPLFATHPSPLQRISVYKAFHLNAPGKQHPGNSMLDSATTTLTKSKTCQCREISRYFMKYQISV